MADKRVLVIVPFPLDDEGVANRKVQLDSVQLGLYMGDMISGMLDGGARVQHGKG